MTNYTRLATCAATATNLAVRLKQKWGSRFPTWEQHQDPREHLGANASWEQRRTFESAWLVATIECSIESAKADGASAEVMKELEFLKASAEKTLSGYLAREF